MTSHVYRPWKANDILPLTRGSLFFNNKPYEPFAMPGSCHVVRCKAEVSLVMKAVDWSFSNGEIGVTV